MNIVMPLVAEACVVIVEEKVEPRLNRCLTSRFWTMIGNRMLVRGLSGWIFVRAASDLSYLKEWQSSIAGHDHVETRIVLIAFDSGFNAFWKPMFHQQ